MCLLCAWAGSRASRIRSPLCQISLARVPRLLKLRRRRWQRSAPRAFSVQPECQPTFPRGGYAVLPACLDVLREHYDNTQRLLEQRSVRLHNLQIRDHTFARRWAFAPSTTGTTTPRTSKRLQGQRSALRHTPPALTRSRANWVSPVMRLGARIRALASNQGKR
jgi:hypothetical protein